MNRLLLNAILASSSGDADAKAYIDAVGLSGSTADLLTKIVLDLKGKYSGATKKNTSGTNYWNDILDVWLFDRSLNVISTTAKSLKLLHNVTPNSATLDATNGLVCDSTDTPQASISTVFDTGITIIYDHAYKDATNATYDVAFSLGPDTNLSSDNDALGAFISAAGSTFSLIAAGSFTTFVYPGFEGSSVWRQFWYSWAPSSGSWYYGNSTASSSGSIGDRSFGDSDNDFTPTILKFAHGKPFSVTTYYRHDGTYSYCRFCIILDRTTTSSERDELINILTAAS